VQANLIVLRIREDQADEFERLFGEEEMPVWQELAEQGDLVEARLVRVRFGSEEEPGIRHYGIWASFTSMAGHTAHDDHPRLQAMLRKARTFQPKSPLVFGGETIFEQAAGARGEAGHE
jgi:hypothetical protein